MDVDGFDPWDFDDESWRDELQVMGEDFQEALKKRGITRKLPERTECRTCGGSRCTMEYEGHGPLVCENGCCPDCKDPPSVTAWLNDGVVASDDLPRRFVECPACHGAGGGMLRNGDWIECEDCRGTGDIPNPGRPLFRFTGF